MWLNEAELWRQAGSHEAAGHPQQALPLYANLFRQLEENGRQVPSALVERMADCSRALENFPQAMEFFRAARDGMQEVGDTEGTRRITAHMATTLLESGSLEAAVLLLRDALELEGDDELVVALERLLGDETNVPPSKLACVEAAVRCLAASGSYQDAITITRRAMRLTSERSQSHAGEYQLFLAELLVDSGAFAQAIVLIPSSPTARWSLLAARARRFMGDLGSALAHCEKAEKAAGAVVRSKAALLKAAIFSQLNRVGAAESVLHTAANLDDTPENWRVRMLRAAALFALRRQAAKDAMQLPLGLDDLWTVSNVAHRETLATTAPDSNEWSERYADRVAATLNRVSVELAHGHPPIDEIASIKALRDGCDAPLQQQRLWAGEAWIRYYSAQYAEAEECWAHAVELAGKLGTPLYAWEARVALSWCAARRGDLVGQERLAREARHDLEGMAAALDLAQRRHFLLNKVSARDEYLALEARAISRANSPWFGVPWLGRWLKRLDQRMKARGLMNRAALISQFGVQNQLAGGTWRVTPDTAVTATQVELMVQRQLAVTGEATAQFAARRFSLNCQRRLKAGEAMIQYLPLPDQMLIIWTTRDDAGLMSSAVTRPELDSAVRDCLQAILEEDEYVVPPMHATKPLRRLSQLLKLDELCELLDRCTHWFLAPADVLVNVPFSALPVASGSFLVELASISLIPNPGWLRTLPKRRGKSTKGALVVGCSSYPPISQLAPLPNARLEAEAVSKELIDRFNVTCLLDEAANEAAVVEQLEGAHVAHFACHCQADSEAPLDSCLRFSALSEGGDRLTAQRLYGLKLSLRVAVLAACRASASTPLPDSDLVGIPAAFLYAGTESVVAPLWEVSDELSRAAMRQLHQKMATSSAAGALRSMQRARCRSVDETESRIFNWAAYTCFSLS